MALEYNLQVQTRLPILNFVEDYLNENNIAFSEDKIQNNIDLYETLGITISSLYSEKVFLEYMINKQEIIEEEWSYSNNILFRLDKFYDNLSARLNVIEVCAYILKNTNEDVLMLFNNELLVLQRTNGTVKINKSYGFWDSDQLLEVITPFLDNSNYA